MIRIAFCDDALSVLGELQTLLDRYRAERNQPIEYTAFQSPLDLLDKIEKGTIFDILFLDILMPGPCGINIAAEIRNLDSNTKIIFLTPSADFTAQSYMVGNYFYQIKSTSEENFFHLMDSAISACKKERKESLILQCKNQIARIESRQLEYCEVTHRTLFIHLSDGRILEKNGSLDTLSKQLERFGCFYRPHRSYLINLDYVESLSYRSVIMSCLAEIPLPRGKYHEIKDAYLKYMQGNGHIMI